VSILGTRVLRTEDPAFLTRGAVHTDDVQVQDERLAGACYAHFVRSPVAHARIKAIDAGAALQGNGVIAVYTGTDLAEAGLRPVPPMMPGRNEQMLQPLLATDVARYAGEPVAVVLTEQPYRGEDAIELVDVDYEPLPAVIDLDDALSGARGLLFPDAETNVAIKFGDEAYFSRDLFDACDVVVSETIVNQRVAPAPMETRAAAAVKGEDGRLTAWIPNQGAQAAKAALAGQLGIAPEELRVITPDVGGGLGAKYRHADVPAAGVAGDQRGKGRLSAPQEATASVVYAATTLTRAAVGSVA
jgi:aerobic carbon-monoxide dehydrogenase large subunit